jgi:hypothetical protein
LKIPTPKPDFIVSKWYADVIHEKDSSAFIVYWAELKWKLLKINFSSFIQRTSLGKIISKSTFLKTSSPYIKDDIFYLNIKNLKGIWEKNSTSLSVKLLETEEGYILWECFMPLAKANIILSSKKYQGLGYVERLTFTLKPWQMPIKILHWGRFLSENHHIVWICWEGSYPQTWVFYNGQQKHNALVNSEEVVFEDFKLRFIDKKIIREGKLISTIFKKFQFLKTIFPANVLNMEECKWLSDSSLYHQNMLIAKEKVIHERVEFV